MQWTRLTALALLALPAMAAAAPPASDKALEERVEALLSGIEAVPSRTEWVALGPKAGVVLRRIAADPKARVIRRARESQR